MDMEAGIEHLGRGTAESVDAFIVVVEPGERSLQTYRKVKKLGNDIGVKKVFVVGNKVRNKCDEEFIKYVYYWNKGEKAKSSSELLPSYLRLSQAERELKKKENK